MDLKEAQSPPLRHPWETARLGHFLRVLLPRLPETDAELLDFGSGDAWLATELARRRPGLRVTCVDAYYGAEELRRLAAAHPQVRFGASLEGGGFDAVLALDVLEHVEDDEATLHRLAEACRPGGLLLLSVPGWPALFGSHDRFLGHVRRYTLRRLTALAAGEPVRILRRGGLFTSLLGARCLLTLSEGSDPEARPHSDAGRWRGGAFLTAIAHGMLAADAWMHRTAATLGVPLPGLSWWILCRKS